MVLEDHKEINKMSKQLIVDYIPFEVTPEQINESIQQQLSLLFVYEPIDIKYLLV